MKIIGMEKSSFIDYPEKIATVFFTAGCNFRCPYCHNATIVKGEGEAIEEKEIFSFLEKRKKFIDAVCISGGEPTLYPELYDFVKKVKEKGFFVKLDTNGTNPEMLERLLNQRLLDYVAMDLKAPLHKYNVVTATEVDIKTIELSMNILKESNIDYEFRTTICKELLSLEDVKDMAETIKGSKKYYLQSFKDSDMVLEGKGKFTVYSKEELKGIVEEIKHHFKVCKIRR